MLGSLRCLPWGLAACLLGTAACGEPTDKNISVVRVRPEAAPLCGAPADARTMILRAMGEFPASEATAQSLELGSEGQFAVERFPPGTSVLEAEVRGFGGALRTVGRSVPFALEALADGGEIALFMAPLEGVCLTGPATESRLRPQLARSGDDVLVVGGTDIEGAPSLSVEIYRPALGRFETLDTTTYGDTSALGLAGASMTTLSNGDIAIVGGAATAYQIFDHASEEFAAPAFYREARGRHAATVLPDGRLFLAGGCSQVNARGCSDGSELLTSAFLDVVTGDIELGPGLRQERIGGTAWLGLSGEVLLVGGVDGDGQPVAQAERVFLAGGSSELIPGLRGPSAQTANGTVWAGLSADETATDDVLAALAPDGTIAATNMQAAFPDADATLVALDDGSVLGVGIAGAQRIRTLEGQGIDLGVDALVGRHGQSAIKLGDGSVLVTGGQLSSGDPAPAAIFRPRLLGPQSASSTATFSSLELSEGLSASTPDRVRIESEGGAHLRVDLEQVDAASLLLSGPSVQNGSLQIAAAASDSASIGLYFGWESASDYDMIFVEPDSEPVLLEMREGQDQSSAALADCTGSIVPRGALEESAGVHEIDLQVRSGKVTLRIGGDEVLVCTLEDLPPRGHMGLAVFGSGESLRLDLISVSR